MSVVSNAETTANRHIEERIPEQNFSLCNFWAKHKVKILVGTGVGVLVVTTLALAIIFWPAAFGIGGALAVTTAALAIGVKIGTLVGAGVIGFGVPTVAAGGFSIKAKNEKIKTLKKEQNIQRDPRLEEFYQKFCSENQPDWLFWPLYVGLAILDVKMINRCREIDYFNALHHDERNPIINDEKDINFKNCVCCPRQWFEHKISWDSIRELKEIIGNNRTAENYCWDLCNNHLLTLSASLRPFIVQMIEARESVLNHLKLEEALAVLTQAHGASSQYPDDFQNQVIKFLKEANT